MINTLVQLVQYDFERVIFLSMGYQANIKKQSQCFFTGYDGAGKIFLVQAARYDDTSDMQADKRQYLKQIKPDQIMA